MKKLTALIGAIIMAGFFASCGQSVTAITTTVEAVSIAPEVIPVKSNAWITERINSQPNDAIQILPKIRLENFPPGGMVETWVVSSTCLDNTELNTLKGNTLTLDIYNGFASGIDCLVYYHAPLSNTVDADTGLGYSPAPKETKDWLTIADYETTPKDIAEIFSVNGPSTTATIPAYSVLHLPIKLSIPKEAKNLPKRWEFDIKVSGIGFITTALDQRWLITMR